MGREGNAGYPWILVMGSVAEEAPDVKDLATTLLGRWKQKFWWKTKYLLKYLL